MEKNKIFIQDNRGITLVVLVITVILMSILAVLIIDISVDGQLFSFTKKASADTEITSEKQTILQASAISETLGKVGKTQAENLQATLDEMTAKGTTTVTYISPKIEIRFNDTKRVYVLDEDGNLEGPK